MNYYNKIVKYSGYLASGLFITIGFIVSYEVIARYIFNSPTIWVNEVSRFLQIWATYLALTYSFHKKDFIRITVIYDKLNESGKKVLDFISFIFILIFHGMGSMTNSLTMQTERYLEGTISVLKEYSTGIEISTKGFV